MSRLGGQATTPIGARQIERERSLPWNWFAPSEMRIDATVSDVAVIRFEDGGPQPQAILDRRQVHRSKLALGNLACPRRSTDEAPNRRIRLHRAERLEIIRLVIPEEQSLRLEDDQPAHKIHANCARCVTIATVPWTNTAVMDPARKRSPDRWVGTLRLFTTTVSAQ